MFETGKGKGGEGKGKRAQFILRAKQKRDEKDLIS